MINVLPGCSIPMRTGVVPDPDLLPRSPGVTGRLLSITDAVTHQEAWAGHRVVVIHQGVQGAAARHVRDAQVAALSLLHTDHLEAVYPGVVLLDAPGHHQQRELAPEVHTPAASHLTSGLSPA